MKIDGAFIVGQNDNPVNVIIDGNKISGIEKAESGRVWISPGFIDAHIHMGWTDFFHEKQALRSKEDIENCIRKSMDALLRMGFTSIRDAGGLSPRKWDEIKGLKGFFSVVPDAYFCSGMIDSENYHSEDYIESVLSQDGEWVKIFATGGVGLSPKEVINPLLSEPEFAELVSRIHENGKRIMVHTYGGESLNWCIKYGVESVEHCVYMTKEQAKGLSEKGIFYIPTASIYSMISDGEEIFELPDFIKDNAQSATMKHPYAIEAAVKAGVRIVFGTDFYSDKSLIEKAFDEFFILQKYGLTPLESFNCATLNGVSLLGLSDCYGKIREGFFADIIVFDKDPLKTSNGRELKDSIIGIYKKGTYC